MSKKKREWTRKGVTASMAVVLAFGMTPVATAVAEEAPAAESAYSDVDGHWAESAIERWSGYGVVHGDAGMFNPGNEMTRAEAAVAYANLLGLEAEADLSGFSDVDSSAWYAEGVAKCVAAGILQGDGQGKLSPLDTISREQMFLVLARVLGLAPEDACDVEFSDAGQVSSWAQGAINALVNRGVVSGMGDGTLAPGADIDRASVMMMLDMAVDDYVVDDGASVEADGGTVLVVADDVTVTGSARTVVIAGSGNSASVSAQVSEATVLGPESALTFAEGAKVGSVSVPASAEGASVVVASGAEVGSLVSAAKGVSVSGEGSLASAEVSGDDTAVNTDGTDLSVAEGVSGVTENGKPVAGGETVETAPEETPAPPAVTYFTVTFENAEGGTISSYAAASGSTVSFPEVEAGEGQKVSWYDAEGNWVAAPSTATVSSDCTFTAVVGSDDFAAGAGTEAFPYLIANAGQFEKIVNGESASDIVFYELVSDIDLCEVAESSISLRNVSFDGNGKRVYSSTAKIPRQGLFATAQGKVVVKNMVYDLTNFDSKAWAPDLTPLIYEATGVGSDILVDGVKIEGDHSIDSNNGPFVMNESMQGGTLKFANCEMAASLSGDGYNSCFVGWQLSVSTPATIAFDSCEVSGELVCPRASVVAANGTNAGSRTYEYTGNNVLSGSVQGTLVAKYFTAVSESALTSFETAAQEAFVIQGSGSIWVGAVDSGLSISKGEDAALTVTPSDNENVTKYVVRVGLYTNYYTAEGVKSGTWKFFATQEIDAKDIASLDIIKAYDFVDYGYDGLSNIADDGNGNLIGTVDGEQCYVVKDYVFDDGLTTLQGYVGAPSALGKRSATLVSVDAYVGDDLYSTASLK